MLLKYDININPETIVSNLSRLVNQIYKLLPTREEGADWAAPLSTIIEELAGMASLFEKLPQQKTFLSLISKLEGLFDLAEESNFLLFRRIIFECLSLLAQLKNLCQD